MADKKVRSKKDEDKNPVVGVVEDAVEAVTSAVGSAAETVGSAVGSAAEAVGSAVTSVLGRDEDKQGEGDGKIERKGAQVSEYLHKRRTELGRVVSDKMEKTVVVLVERSKPHPIYKKVMRRSVKFMAHNDLGAATGDTVRIIEWRPMSKRKRWNVVEIVKRADQL